MFARILSCAAIAGLLLVPGCQRDSTPVISPKPSVISTQPVVPAVAKGPVVPANLNGGAILFQDRTESSRVRFKYHNDDAHSDFAILESLGGGVALFDFDGDGRFDLFVPGGGT